MRLSRSVVTDFGFGVDDAVVVVTTPSLTVAKLPEISTQFDFHKIDIQE